jgi:O-Antigen ligase
MTTESFGVYTASRTSQPLHWVLLLLSLVPLCVVLPLAPVKVGIAVIAAWICVLWVTICYLQRQFHYAVLLWVAVYPYCYYLLSFPAEHSIFTLDRAFILLLVLEMLIASRQATDTAPLTRDVRISGYLWVLYLLVCFLSLADHPVVATLPFYRELVEGMLMPAVLGLYAMRYFPLIKSLQKLHTCACFLGIGLCITGLIELTTDIDLFPWKGSVPMFTDTHIRRADGPFEQQIVLSVVAILAFFFILYLRKLMPARLTHQREMLHHVGWLAALGAALLPLNRGLILMLGIIATIEWFSSHRLLPRAIWAGFFGCVLVAGVTAMLLDPRLYNDRVSSPDNVYQRLAQHRETLHFVRENPYLGLGFGLYHEVATRNPQNMAEWNGIESMNYPHNALMTVLSEEGLIGLIFYVGAQFFLIRAMWRMRKAFAPGWLAFLYCILIYILTGLDYATVYFSDINLFYLFILGVLYQLQIRTASDPLRASLVVA